MIVVLALIATIIIAGRFSLLPTVNDGVMTITLPKLEVTPKSRITIK